MDESDRPGRGKRPGSDVQGYSAETRDSTQELMKKIRAREEEMRKSKQSSDLPQPKEDWTTYERPPIGGAKDD